MMKNLRVLLLALSLGLTPALAWAAGWLPLASWIQSGAIIDEIFTTGQYYPRPIATEFVDSRASSKFLTNASGVLVSVNNNVLPISSAGLLNEPSGTNNVLQSQAFSAWVVANSVLTTSASSAPDGNVNAATLTANVAAAFHTLAANTASALNGRTDCYSVYVKPLGATIYFPVLQGFGGGAYAVFNLAAGTTANSGGATSGIITYPNGWYRIWAALPNVSFTGTTNSFIGFSNSPLVGGYTSFAGDGASGFTLAYPQYEYSATSPSSFMLTTTIAVTRAADSITIQRTGIGRVVFTFDDNSTQTVSGIDTGLQYTIPTNLNRPLIQRMTGYAS